MRPKFKHTAAVVAIVAALTINAGCGMFDPSNEKNEQTENVKGVQNEQNVQNEQTTPPENSNPDDAAVPEANNQQPEKNEEPDTAETPSGETADNNQSGTNGEIQVVAEPEAMAVLVNKRSRLPDDYEPNDLVYPDVPFIFNEMLDKRKMRKEAAAALESLFAAAKQDGIYLAGVSGYRSKATQQSLYNNYVARDGQEAADLYSARPGHSEHQTGLAMDVSGSTGKCAAQDCFAGTEEANWLAEHAHEHGFIIRYPEGKEEITGYQYEPWHLRYVGIDIATEIYEADSTLEEYLGQAIPVDQS